jgi:hypothetical protein
MSTQPVDDALEEKRRLPHRLTWWSAPWALLLAPIWYELYTIREGKPGGPLSHVVWWALGEQYGARWWLIGFPLAGFFVWVIAHFLFEWPAVRELGFCVGAGLIVGLLGWLACTLTR